MAPAALRRRENRKPRRRRSAPRHPADVRGHPFFLLRHTESDPDEIGTRLVDRGDIGRVLFSAQHTERRRSRVNQSVGVVKRKVMQSLYIERLVMHPQVAIGDQDTSSA